MFSNCAVWRQAAENVAETLTKGMRVIVQGRLKSRSYETREGERRTVFEVDVEEIGLPCVMRPPRSTAPAVAAVAATTRAAPVAATAGRPTRARVAAAVSRAGTTDPRRSSRTIRGRARRATSPRSDRPPSTHPCHSGPRRLA